MLPDAHGLLALKLPAEQHANPWRYGVGKGLRNVVGPPRRRNRRPLVSRFSFFAVFHAKREAV